MKVNFPHMGTSHIAFDFLLKRFGHEPVVKKPNKQTLSFGTKFSPEFACFPFKILMGTYIAALEDGADLLITSGGVGPCRAGLYAPLHQKILREMGYQFEMVVFEPPKLELLSFLRKVKKVAGDQASWLDIIKAVYLSWQKLKALDRIEQLSHWIRPRTTDKKGLDYRLQKVYSWIDEAATKDEIKEAASEGDRYLKKLPHDPEQDVIKIGVVGEIYVLLEPAANLEIEKTLGNMGGYVKRSLFLTGWTVDNTLYNTSEDLKVKELARPFLEIMVGGHGQDSIGHTVKYAREGFDGVVQLAPFTCIPEIVAKSIIPQVSKEYGIPVLTLFLDEKTGQAGMVTRLEAFMDMLQYRKQNSFTEVAG
ncbi:MAG: 2-hydroxyacyl-CoA dehydratase [Halanaerobium sp.]|nr:2-hydroxyacyl-CoA dehydratase [Halanaerobium sp.]